MENKNQHIFKIAWAQMPLSKEEIETIPYNHRIRPYLLCMDMGDYYYAFPTTSKILSNKTRYENEKVIISETSSLVILHKIFRLPKRNLLERPRYLRREYSNEIIKKINSCIAYNKYPKDFADFFMYESYSLEENDIIEYNGELHLIIETDDEKYYLHKVYSYPVNGSVLVEIDGCKYYVDVTSLYKLNKSENPIYRTRISKQSLKGTNIKDWILNRPILRNQKDHTLRKNLIPGMVIDTCFDEEDVKLVILERNGDKIMALYGNPTTTYNYYELGEFSIQDIPFYLIVNTISDERLEKLRSKHTRKEYTREKKYK